MLGNSNRTHFFWFDVTPTGRYEKQWLFLKPGEDISMKAPYMARFIVQYDYETDQAHYLKNRDGCQTITHGDMLEILHDARINLRDVKDIMGFSSGLKMSDIQAKGRADRVAMWQSNLCPEITLPKDRKYEIKFNVENMRNCAAKPLTLSACLDDIVPPRLSSDMILGIQRMTAPSGQIFPMRNKFSPESEDE